MVKVHTMSHSLPARLLLIFTLLFVQTGGLMHEISHVAGNQSQSQDHSLPHEKHCDLCAAYAQLGTALGSHSIEQRSVLADTTFDTVNATLAFTAFAARAPPYSA
jgi:hypothetical protein